MAACEIALAVLCAISDRTHTSKARTATQSSPDEEEGHVGHRQKEVHQDRLVCLPIHHLVYPMI